MTIKKIVKTSSRVLVISLLLFSTLWAQSGIEPQNVERVGLAGWQFLKINLDPRQAAMAGSFAATSHGDVGAIFGNPAALVDIKSFQASFNNVQYVADMAYYAAAIAKNVKGIGVFGISVAAFDVGDIPRTINQPIPGEDRTEAYVTGETFTGGDFAAGLSYARRLTDLLSVGGNIRWIREKIDDLSMNNICFDVGTMFYTGFRSLRLGMTARSFGPDQQLVGWSEEVQIQPVDIRMPLDFRVGLAMDFLEGQDSPHFLTVTLEGTHPNDGPEKVHLGAEYWFHNILSLRGGYRANYDEGGFTFGGGLNYSMDTFGGQINYAFVDFGRLKAVHMFNLMLSF